MQYCITNKKAVFGSTSTAGRALVTAAAVLLVVLFIASGAGAALTSSGNTITAVTAFGTVGDAGTVVVSGTVNTASAATYLVIDPDYDGLTAAKVEEGRSIYEFSAAEVPVVVRGANLTLAGSKIIAAPKVTFAYGDGSTVSVNSVPWSAKHSYLQGDNTPKISEANLLGSSAELALTPVSVTADDVKSHVTATTITAGGTATPGDASAKSVVEVVVTNVDSTSSASSFVYITGDTADYNPNPDDTYTYVVTNPRGAALLTQTVSSVEKIASGAILDIDDDAKKTVAPLNTYVWGSDASGTKLEFTLPAPAVDPKKLTLKNIFDEKTWLIIAINVVKGNTFPVDTGHIGLDVGTPDPNTIHVTNGEEGVKTEVTGGKMRVTVPLTFTNETLDIAIGSTMASVGLEEAEKVSTSDVALNGSWENPRLGEKFTFAWNLSGKAKYVQVPSEGIYTYNSTTKKSGMHIEIDLKDVTVARGDTPLEKDTDFEIVDGEIHLLNAKKLSTYTYTIEGDKKLGDVDGDNIVNIADASAICYNLVNDESFTPDMYMDADINGYVSGNDARLIALFDVGL